MGKKVGLADVDHRKSMNRDHRTIKQFVYSGKTGRKTPRRSHLRTLSSTDIRKLKIEMTKTPHAISKYIFDAAGVYKMGKTARCETLRTLGKVRKPQKQPPLSKLHKRKRVEWAHRYMKTDFKNVIFTNECRATLDIPDGWASGWILNGHQPGVGIRRQEGGGGVKFWEGIKGNVLFGPFKVEPGVKINSTSYCELLNKHLILRLEDQPLSLWRTMIFQQDNAPAHRPEYTSNWLKNAGFKDERVMVRPPNSPDLNPMENFWAIIKRRVYSNGRQFAHLNDLWIAIQEVSASITPSEISNLTSSVDQRLVKILKNNRCHVSA